MTSKKTFRSIVCAALCLCAADAFAIDGGSFTGFAPYTVFGIGELSPQGSAYNTSMGGVGIASRNSRYLNFMNPAAVTSRDSLSFMTDFSLTGTSKVFAQGSRKSANNTFNLGDFALSFPLWNHTAMMVGIRPYSSTGYSYGYYETDPQVINAIGNASHAYTGQGGTYEFFTAAGVELFKRLSLGAEYQYYFGNIQKNYIQSVEDEAALSINQTYDMYLTAHSAKFGLQYDQPIGNKLRVCLGATYSLAANFNGYSNYTKTSGSMTLESTSDTLANLSSKVGIAAQAGIGLSINYMDKFRAEINYQQSDWSKCGYESVTGLSVNNYNGPIFKGSQSRKVSVGVEYLPNLADIRYYYKKIAYRAGAYYGTENYTVLGNTIVSTGITVGATFPVFRWCNGLTVAFDFGQRGTLKNDLVRERYFGMSFGVNLYDIWFLKNQYE